MANTFTEPEPTPLSLLLLGHGSDPASERGVDCPGDLPAPSDPGLVERARTAIRAAFVRGIERVGGFGGKSDVLAECQVFHGDPGCFRRSERG